MSIDRGRRRAWWYNPPVSDVKDKVLVAMSGGVDSSVAAAVLLEAGCEVTGVFLCLGAAGPPDGERTCCSPEDAADARRVAQKLGIGLHVLNVAGDFEPIIRHFAEEYARGRTPNPCILCNARVKFARLIRLADRLGIARVATGHHARVAKTHGEWAVLRARDARKDQSYALFAVAREHLGRVVLPIGEMEGKAAVRERARALGLNVHDKPDSQEICFVPDGDYLALLAERAPRALTPGDILSAGGEVLGRHDGYARFTVGQRRGLGVAAGEPRYVTRIDAATATVTLGTREQASSGRLAADGAAWHADVPEQFDATVQVRYNHRGERARVRRLGAGRFEADFERPVHAITPGQAAVVYDGERLLGGGWIC